MPFLDTPKSRARALILVLGLALLYALRPFLSGLLGAIILAVVFAPLHKRLAARMPSRLAAAIVVLIALIVILLPAAWLTGVLIAEAPEAFKTVQESSALGRFSTFQIGSFAVGPELARASGTVMQWLSTRFMGLVGGAARALLNIVIALFGLYFMIVSSGSLWPRFRALLPFSEANAELLRERFNSVTQATLLGIVFTATLQGLIVGLAFWGVGLARPAFWGVMTGIASILPLFGSGLIWLPGSLVLAVEQQYVKAFILLAIGVVVASNVDNVIRPLVYRRVSNIHPMVTLVGGFAGVSAFGLIGLLLGPLAIAYFFELLELYEEEYGGRRAAQA